MAHRVMVIARPYDGEVIRRGLVEAGYEVVAATAGPDLHRLVEDRRPSVVVLSLRLPPPGGRDALLRIRAGEHGRWVPVLLVGEAGAGVTSREQAEEIGADDLVLRPLDLSTINARVATLIEDRVMEFVAGGPTRTLTGLPSSETAIPDLDPDERERAVTTVEPRIDHAGALPGGSTGEPSGARRRLQLGIEAANLLVEGIARTLDDEALAAALGGTGARLRLTAAGAGEVDRASMGMAERVTVGLLDGQRTLGEVAEMAPLDPQETMQVAYALVLLGAVARDPAGTGQARADAADAPAAEEAIRERHALVREGDYFSLLGVPPEAGGAEILAAYEAARATFDPTRQPGDVATRLAGELADIAAALDEACRVLLDDRRRAAYRAAIA